MSKTRTNGNPSYYFDRPIGLELAEILADEDTGSGARLHLILQDGGTFELEVFRLGPDWVTGTDKAGTLKTLSLKGVETAYWVFD